MSELFSSVVQTLIDDINIINIEFDLGQVIILQYPVGCQDI